MIKKMMFGLISSIVVALFLVACAGDEGYGSSSGGGSGGGSSCSTGNCLNNGQCCPKSHPNYTYGGHGYQAGCYASCPYVGDCGSSTQCF